MMNATTRIFARQASRQSSRHSRGVVVATTTTTAQINTQTQTNSFTTTTTMTTGPPARQTATTTNNSSLLDDSRYSFSSLMSSSSSSPPHSPLFSSPSIRSFSATTSGGGGGGDGKDGDNNNDVTEVAPPVIDFESNANANTNTAEYDPYEITKSFEDTSYYYPPVEETDPQFLAAKYEGMTNEELLDTSTIINADADADDIDIDTQHTWDTLMHAPPIRDKNAALPKGTLVGKVVSTKMTKTVNVAVDRYKIHPKYRKRIRYTRKFMAHDEKEVASMGDTVLIVPSQRISKMKHFVLSEIIRAKGQL